MNINNLNPANSLFEYIDSRIQFNLNLLPKAIPCQVQNVKNNIVDVMSLLKTNNISSIITDVPVMRPIYFHYPIKTGDLGLLICSNYAFYDFVEKNTLIAGELQKVFDGSGYLFLPLAPTMADFTKDKEAFELYSLDGFTSLVIDNEKIEIKDNAGEEDTNNILIDTAGISIADVNKNKITFTETGIDIIDLNENKVNINEDGINILDLNENNIVLNSDGITVKDANGNTITLSSSGILAEDANGNKIETTSSAVNIEASSGCKIEMGATSVKINGNLEVLQ